MDIAYEPAHCPVCGHADAKPLAETQDIQREVEERWAFHERRLSATTPASRLMDRVAFSEPAPLRLVRCRDCGLVYRNPAERQSVLAEAYTRESPAPETLDSLREAQLPAARAQARRLRHDMGRLGSVLEVGSYVGAFLAAGAELGLTVSGVDVNADVNAFTRARGFSVHDGELATLGDAPTAAGAFDAVAIWNTFDQVPDPRATLFAASRVLRGRGLIVLRVPSGAFYARMQPLLGAHSRAARAFARELLAQNNLLGFPYRWGFAVPALRRLLADAGFEIERVYGDVLVPTADEYTRRWARVEEIVIKGVLRLWARRSVAAAPWLEVYARKC